MGTKTIKGTLLDIINKQKQQKTEVTGRQTVDAYCLFYQFFLFLYSSNYPITSDIIKKISNTEEKQFLGFFFIFFLFSLLSKNITTSDSRKSIIGVKKTTPAFYIFYWMFMLPFAPEYSITAAFIWNCSCEEDNTLPIPVYYSIYYCSCYFQMTKSPPLLPKKQSH